MGSVPHPRVLQLCAWSQQASRGLSLAACREGWAVFCGEPTSHCELK